MEPPKLKKIVRKLEVPHEKARFNEMFIKFVEHGHGCCDYC